MAQTRLRSSIPQDPSDSPLPSLPKKLKTAHPADASVTDPTGSADGENFAPEFAPGLFDLTHIRELHTTYAANLPFKYAVLEKLFQDELLENVKDECLRELHFSQKETDIYKVNQTGDLASLSFLTPEQIALFPALLRLRDALYSARFRSFLRAVTGCGALSATKQDMSVNSYTKGCHLLNHDDVIGTRRVSYILYMPVPRGQPWRADWGGALELYGRREGPDGPEPLEVPAKSIPPAWNQFVFFEVQPGKSFHSVEEVVVGGEGDEDARERLSISGWFHVAQEGEEGYEPELPAREVKSSREQLTSSSTEFKSYPESAEPPMPDAPLSEEHIAFLSEFINPVYLRPRTMNSLAARFVEESSVEMHSFLSDDIASKLEAGLRKIDAKNKLGVDRSGSIPSHDSGTSGGWTIRGPPHKWRYCTLSPPSTTGPVAVARPRAAQSPIDIVRSLQEELFASPAFRAWLATVSKLVPLRYTAEARRFRPGLDYTLATSEDAEARLDVVLGLTPSVEGPGGGKGVNEREEEKGWLSGEWGGWECYMAPHEGEEDPAVYRSGGSRNKETTKSDAHAAGGHINGASSSAAERQASNQSEDEEMDDDDSTLLAVQPGFNRLLLVLRDEGVMHFVKYVSAAAGGSRWDVCGEYEIGVLQVNEDGEE